MSIVLSPNMSLPVPQVGSQAGPAYATNINDCLSILDQHDHASGSGVPVTAEGINITSDLTFNGSNATSLRSARMNSQGSPLALASDLNCLYVSAGDLYYNDALGNQIQITQNGGVAGSPGSISNLTSPASAAYVSASAKFTWQSDVNVAASMDMRNAILRNSAASSKGLTLSPPNAMASDYTITLPALPAATGILQLSTGGTVSATLVVDNSSIEISSNTLQVKDAGITISKLAAMPSGTTASLGGIAISASTASYTNTGTVLSTAATVTITTSGRPVYLMLQPDGQTGANRGFLINGASGDNARYCFFRGLTQISETRREGSAAAAPGSVCFIDTPAAGTYTYTLQAALTAAGTSVNITRCKLVAYEI